MSVDSGVNMPQIVFCRRSHPIVHIDDLIVNTGDELHFLITNLINGATYIDGIYRNQIRCYACRTILGFRYGDVVHILHRHVILRDE